MTDWTKWPPEWTPDCQGKWDYDGALIYVSTRYWGQGPTVLDTNRPELGFRVMTPPDFKPSAHGTVYFGNIVLWEKDFKADTESQVKAQVEQWAEERRKQLLGIIYNSMWGRSELPIRG